MAMISCAVAPRSANRVDVAFLNPCEVQWEGSPHCSKFVPKAGGRKWPTQIRHKTSRFAALLGIGRDWQSAGFDDCSFLVSKFGQTQRIPLTSLRTRTLWNGWFFNSIRIEVEKSTPILLKGIGRSKARIAFEKLASTIDEAASSFKTAISRGKPAVFAQIGGC